jgi:short-subunit dehydrogenase
VVDIRDRWAVVTGGSSGIGLAFAETLAARGANIVMVSIQDQELRAESQRVAETYGVKVLTLLLDLTRADVVEVLNDFYAEHDIDPYVFVNNAGIFSFKEVADTSEAKIQAYIDLHVRAVTMLSRAMALRMSQRPQDGKAPRGFILNMSSMSCWSPMPGLAMYAATKAYIRVFSRSLHYEMRPAGVRVMVCCPGGIATDLFGLPPNLMRLALRLHAVDTPQSFTRKAVKRLLRGKMQYINGMLNRMAIFAVGITPTPVRMLVKRLMLDKNITRG